MKHTPMKIHVYEIVANYPQMILFHFIMMMSLRAVSYVIVAVVTEDAQVQVPQTVFLL